MSVLHTINQMFHFKEAILKEFKNIKDCEKSIECSSSGVHISLKFNEHSAPLHAGYALKGTSLKDYLQNNPDQGSTIIQNAFKLLDKTLPCIKQTALTGSAKIESNFEICIPIEDTQPHFHLCKEFKYADVLFSITLEHKNPLKLSILK